MKDLFYYSHSVNASVQTKYEVQLAEAACQSIKRKEREVRSIRSSFNTLLFLLDSNRTRRNTCQ
jgi:hypothetical protein